MDKELLVTESEFSQPQEILKAPGVLQEIAIEIFSQILLIFNSQYLLGTRTQSPFVLVSLLMDLNQFLCAQQHLIEEPVQNFVVADAEVFLVFKRQDVEHLFKVEKLVQMQSVLLE